MKKSRSVGLLMWGPSPPFHYKNEKQNKTKQKPKEMVKWVFLVSLTHHMVYTDASSQLLPAPAAEAWSP
jgi:hypothetical protein